MSVQRRVRTALLKRAPEEGITRWLHELAHALGYSERAVANWYYEAEGEMTADAVDVLRLHFGDVFLDEVYPRAGEGSNG